MKNTNKVLALLTGVMTVGMPFLALAQVTPPGLPPPVINNVGDVLGTQGIICRIFRWIFAFLIVLAVVFILLAAYKYLTAGGDAEKVKAANKQILFAVIAVVIALIANVIPNIALTAIGSTGVTTC